MCQPTRTKRAEHSQYLASVAQSTDSIVRSGTSSLFSYTHALCRSRSPDGRKHKKSKKRRHASPVSSDADSEEDRRRRERKERKKARKEKEREREHRKRRSRSRSVRKDSEDEDERDRRNRRHRRTRSRSASEEHPRDQRSKTRTKSPEQPPPASEEEDEWVEKPTKTSFLDSASQNHGNGAMAPPPVPASAAAVTSTTAPSDDDSDDEVGPQPLVSATSSSKKRVDERQYGGALLRGEGSAMAAFLQDGTDVRIPRRGEIGLTSDEIAQYEHVGYVMSGSRHRRMNAVRMRKENQVISAEEKRGILKLQQEERERREAILREEFQQLLQENLKSQGGGK